MEYSTKKETSSTFIMGSSMGGLISLYHPSQAGVDSIRSEKGYLKG